MAVPLRRALLGRVPMFARSYAQADAYALVWEIANAAALLAPGPWWVVLGDSAAQGVGASSYDRGYVGQVRALLTARDSASWQVVNLSRSGARTRDVLDSQVPALAPLLSRATLVSALIGGNDALATPARRWRADVSALAAALPAGALMSTVARGVRERRTGPVNEHIRATAAEHGLPLADLWAHTGPPYRGLYADGFHPNETGYRQWTAAIAAAWDLPPSPGPAVTAR